MIIGKQLNTDQQQRNDSSNGASNILVNLKIDIKAVKLLSFTSVSMPIAPLIMASAHTSANIFTGDTTNIYSTTTAPTTSQAIGQTVDINAHMRVLLVNVIFCFFLINIL